MENKPNRIIWHHSGDAFAGEQFDKINAYHKERDFPISSLGYFVGYHYLIEKSGVVVVARGEDEVGAHDAGENLNSIGICIAGDFNYELPTEKQAEAAARLTKEIMARHKIPITRIEPHRWGDWTDCPGKRLHDYWLAVNYITYELGWLKRLLYKLGILKLE